MSHAPFTIHQQPASNLHPCSQYIQAGHSLSYAPFTIHQQPVNDLHPCSQYKQAGHSLLNLLCTICPQLASDLHPCSHYIQAGHSLSCAPFEICEQPASDLRPCIPLAAAQGSQAVASARIRSRQDVDALFLTGCLKACSNYQQAALSPQSYQVQMQPVRCIMGRFFCLGNGAHLAISVKIRSAIRQAITSSIWSRPLRLSL